MLPGPPDQLSVAALDVTDALHAGFQLWKPRRLHRPKVASIEAIEVHLGSRPTVEREIVDDLGPAGPLSEGDLVRERLGTNIGESADQEIARLNLTERIVVSVDANTPIYVVLDRGTKQTSARADHGPVSTTQNLDSLRQMLQLQRELTLNAEPSPH